MRNHLAFLLIMLLMTACRLSTPYQPDGYRGGYSETRLDENVYQVFFNGNANTALEKATDFCMLRSAELTTTQGFNYFIIVDSDSRENRVTQSGTSQAQVYDPKGNDGYGKTTTVFVPQTYTLTKPSANQTIMMYKEKPNVQGLIFKSEFVAKSIREKYNLPQ